MSARMLALTHLMQGLAVAHVTLLVFFLIGSTAFPWCDWERNFDDAPRVMTRVACTCALGLSLFGLALFFLGLMGWLNPAGILVALLALFGAGAAAWRTSPLRGEFWRARALALTHCWNWPLAAIYVAVVVIGTRAVIPDATGYSDAIYYHLAYAQDWATAGRIFVDPYLFFPFYANNFVLLYASWIALGAGEFVQFVTWTVALLAALGLYAAICENAPPLRYRGWTPAIGLLAVLSIIATPIFLDYSVLGYIDVPIGTMALLFVVAVQISLRDRDWRWLAVAAVLAGFLVGMKASYVLLVPVFAVALVWAASVLGARRTQIVATVALLCAVSAPWYVRNSVLAGDPIAPTLNFILYGHDGLWNESEWDGLWSDMATPHTSKAFLTLPLRAYLEPTSPDFREYGASALILFLYVPTIVALAAAALRRRLPPSLEIPIFVLTAFTVYWFATSSLLRYVLLLYPILALCVALLLLELVAYRPRFRVAAVAVALIAVLPSFAQPSDIKEFTNNDVMGEFHILLHYPGDEEYLKQNDEGYPEEQVAVAWMRAHGSGGKVYVISDNAFDYYFRRQGITSVGTWIGPAGYFRLMQAIDAGQAASFLAGIGTQAVLLSPQRLIDENFERLLVRQLTDAGYRRIPLDRGSDYALYVRG